MAKASTAQRTWLRYWVARNEKLLAMAYAMHKQVNSVNDFGGPDSQTVEDYRVALHHTETALKEAVRATVAMREYLANNTINYYSATVNERAYSLTQWYVTQVSTVFPEMRVFNLLKGFIRDRMDYTDLQLKTALLQLEMDETHLSEGTLLYVLRNASPQ